jgi:hypothetical protein
MKRQLILLACSILANQAFALPNFAAFYPENTIECHQSNTEIKCPSLNWMYQVISGNISVFDTLHFDAASFTYEGSSSLPVVRYTYTDNNNHLVVAQVIFPGALPFTRFGHWQKQGYNQFCQPSDQDPAQCMWTLGN